MSKRSPSARRTKQALAALAMKRENPDVVLNYKRFVFSVLCTGSNPIQSMTMMLINNILPPSTTTFYRIQKELKQPIIDIVIQNMKFYKERLPDHTILSFDGAWAHKRNAKQCCVSLYAQNIKKIVDLEIVEKEKAGVDANFTGPSNQMEVFGLMQLIDRWRDDRRISSYCHDNDGKARQLLEKYVDWDELIDSGHSRKSFDNKFNKINELYHEALSAFRDSLTNFLCFLQKSNYSKEERELYWLNSLNHYRGDHSRCPDPNHKVSRVEKLTQEQEIALTEFLFSTTKFTQINFEISTQPNESFNSLHAKICNKNGLFQNPHKKVTFFQIPHKKSVGILESHRRSYS